jgi:hypothetical protein
MALRSIVFLLPLTLTIALLWLIVQNCAPPLCWFLLSIALATIVVLIAACLTSLASCVCRSGGVVRRVRAGMAFRRP